MENSARQILQDRLQELANARDHVLEHPYSIVSRLELALIYNILGYPDLAAGESYKALLLIDEVLEDGEYHEQSIRAAILDVIRASTVNSSRMSAQSSIYAKQRPSQFTNNPREVGPSNDRDPKAWAKTDWSRIAYGILVRSLIDCGSLKSALRFCTRAIEAFPDVAQFESYHQQLLSKLRSYLKVRYGSDDLEGIDQLDYPDKGNVRRELYPWNEHEPDRFSSETIDFLNNEMANIGPKLEVKATDLPILSNEVSLPHNESTISDTQLQYSRQLGVFAKENIRPGEILLQEKSVLTAVARLHEHFCDACSVSLPNTMDTELDSKSISDPIACEECDEVFFCSEECQSLATSSYHPALCGSNFDLILQDVPAAEASDSLYSALLLRTLAMAETQDVHPLDLKEVKYIWGDYHNLPLSSVFHPDADAFCSVPQTLPFSFSANILTPLNMLEKMDINIFEQSHCYDVWIFNTLYAKFRGTASARQGLDGKPEISAVHPMWCLANHSCDPNVAWDWQGSIKFWAREEMVKWEGKEEHTRSEPGIKKGEELRSHYCDVRLPVKERREWAIGALGGNCRCARCVFEAGEEKA